MNKPGIDEMLACAAQAFAHYQDLLIAKRQAGKRSRKHLEREWACINAIMSELQAIKTTREKLHLRTTERLRA